MQDILFNPSSDDTNKLYKEYCKFYREEIVPLYRKHRELSNEIKLQTQDTYSTQPNLRPCKLKVRVMKNRTVSPVNDTSTYIP